MMELSQNFLINSIDELVKSHCGNPESSLSKSKVGVMVRGLFSIFLIKSRQECFRLNIIWFYLYGSFQL